MDYVKLIARKNRIIETLQSRGEMWIGDICTSLGMSFPVDLEKVRGTLKRLDREGVVSKRMGKTLETRRAYYSLTPFYLCDHAWEDGEDDGVKGCYCPKCKYFMEGFEMTSTRSPSALQKGEVS